MSNLSDYSPAALRNQNETTASLVQNVPKAELHMNEYLHPVVSNGIRPLFIRASVSRRPFPKTVAQFRPKASSVLGAVVRGQSITVHHVSPTLMEDSLNGQICCRM
eukprot:482056-Rhodomonas_salina.1